MAFTVIQGGWRLAITAHVYGWWVQCSDGDQRQYMLCTDCPSKFWEMVDQSFASDNIPATRRTCRVNFECPAGTPTGYLELTETSKGWLCRKVLGQLICVYILSE